MLERIRQFVYQPERDLWVAERGRLTLSRLLEISDFSSLPAEEKQQIFDACESEWASSDRQEISHLEPPELDARSPRAGD